jgi:crossover junction endodeoxyribonuclease RusA
MALANQDQFARPLATGPVILRLPTPPSVNHLHESTAKGGRFISKHYEAWKKKAGWELLQQRPRRFEGRVQIIITIQEPKQPRDADNTMKALVDLIKAHGIIPTDDNTCVRKVSAEWSETVANCVIEILPIPAGEARTA